MHWITINLHHVSQIYISNACFLLNMRLQIGFDDDIIDHLISGNHLTASLGVDFTSLHVMC